MTDSQGYEIRHNGVPRTYRDNNKETAFEAARYAKSRHRGDVIEIVECSTGARMAGPAKRGNTQS